MHQTMTNNIQFFDIKRQNQQLKQELDTAIQSVIEQGQFIKGKEITTFENQLATHLNVKHVISCGNGTDALQIALMAMQLQAGDEVIVPAFTYIATIEVIALLGLTPVLVDIDLDTYCISTESIQTCITPRTKAIIPVHLFGQCANMDAVIEIARTNKLYVLEDAAQAIGSSYTFNSGKSAFAGCMGDIGTSSFFPTKNLSCFGDGGVIFTNNDLFAKQIRMIANHGQQQQYIHEMVGVNSRLDTLQAVILQVKLKQLTSFQLKRKANADLYSNAFKDLAEIVIPFEASNCSHVFNQYTLRIKNGKRDALKNYLTRKGIATAIYYPMPLHQQLAYQSKCIIRTSLKNAEQACTEVLSLPIYPELKTEEIEQVINALKLGLGEL